MSTVSVGREQFRQGVFRPSRPCFVNSNVTARITWRWACALEVPAWPAATLCGSRLRAPPERRRPPRRQSGRRGRRAAAAAPAGRELRRARGSGGSCSPEHRARPGFRDSAVSADSRRASRGNAVRVAQSAGRGPRGRTEEEAGASGTGPLRLHRRGGGSQRDGMPPTPGGRKRWPPSGLGGGLWVRTREGEPGCGAALPWTCAWGRWSGSAEAAYSRE